MPFFGSGMVDLPPGGAKRSKNSRKMQMVFFVFYGRVQVEVGTPTTRFGIGKGGMWQVPRGELGFSCFYARPLNQRGFPLRLVEEFPQKGYGNSRNFRLFAEAEDSGGCAKMFRGGASRVASIRASKDVAFRRKFGQHFWGRELYAHARSPRLFFSSHLSIHFLSTPHPLFASLPF